MTEQLLNIINSILENKGKEKLGNISLTTSLRKDIGFDSLDLAEFTVKVENEFGVDIFEDGIVDTIKEVVKKVEK